MGPPIDRRGHGPGSLGVGTRGLQGALGAIEGPGGSGGAMGWDPKLSFVFLISLSSFIIDRNLIRILNKIRTAH